MRAPELQLAVVCEVRIMMWPADSPLLSMWQLSEDTTAARQARLAIRAWLSGLRIDPAGDVGADIVMVASELAANAVVHGQPPVWLSARVDLGSGYVPAIVITVTDGGGAEVSPPVSAPDSEDGRGLAIVAALADWTDTEKTWNATQVRAGFALPDLTVPSPRHQHCNTPSGTVRGGTRPGCPPRASLSAHS
ncbi:MAG TPA: ATP-binding protein [Trebonia sp.]|nr:ATP-binding protein [Trebonia sp.]